MEVVSVGSAYAGHTDTASLLAVTFVFHSSDWGKPLAQSPTVTWLFMPDPLVVSPYAMVLTAGYVAAAIKNSTPLLHLKDATPLLQAALEQVGMIQPTLLSLPRANNRIVAEMWNNPTFRSMFGGLISIDKPEQQFDLDAVTHPAAQTAVNVMGTFLMTMAHADI
jgi:hypothetical protein